MSEFPIVLSRSVFDSALYGPVSSFVSYINHLFETGFVADDLPEHFKELYLLDYYVGQVNNGGHSQFLGNSGDKLDMNIRYACAGAARLDLPNYQRLLEDLSDWIAQNPEEAARQDGFRNRAEALDQMDQNFFQSALYCRDAEDWDYDAAYQSRLSLQSADVQDWHARQVAAGERRDAYQLTLAAHLLEHPQVEWTASWEAQKARVTEISDTSETARARRATEAYKRAQRQISDPDRFALSACFAKLDPSHETWGYFDGPATNTPNDTSEFVVTVAGADGRKLILRREGQNYALCERVHTPATRRRNALWSLGRSLGLISARKMHARSAAKLAARLPVSGGAVDKLPKVKPDEFEAGAILATWRADEDIAQFFLDAHVAEALLMHHDAINRVSFSDGRLISFNKEEGALVWDYVHGIKQISPTETKPREILKLTSRMEITRRGVQITDLQTEESQFYNHAALQNQRALLEQQQQLLG